MTTDILEKNLITIFGLDALSAEEKASFIDELGTVVLETALVRLMAELSEEQVAALNYYLDTEPTADALMEHLLTQHQRFEALMTDAIAEIKTDAIAVLGEPA